VLVSFSSESVLTCVRGCVGAYHGRAIRVMGAAALGLAQKSEAAKFVDIETLSDSSLLFRAPAASLTPLFWVRPGGVNHLCTKFFFFLVQNYGGLKMT